jgi:CDP-6-deoxy-D-xylo-4-hexulose-3-dehydrase
MAGTKRALYATTVYDDREIQAVLNVLNGNPLALRIGKNVREMESRVSALFGKAGGVMVGSGSAALFLAIELLNLPAGSEVITSPLTFSTDISCLVRAGLVPVFVDVEFDTFNIDVARIEEMITPLTRAMLVPNLAGNCPDWDVIREIADRHDLKVVEDSCDAVGAKLRGTPTGTRSDISVTSFSLSHIITAAGQGGMVMCDDIEMLDRALTLRGWGRRSEVHLYGSKRGDRNFWEDLDGIRYDSLFIFDELGFNFLPTELCAAFGVVQVDKLPENYAARRRHVAQYSEFLSKHPDSFIVPRELEELDTAWLCYCFLINPEAGFSRAQLQAHLEPLGVDTRTVWTGNATRQPMMKGVEFRQPADGLPNADRVMEYGILLSCNQGLTEEDVAFVCDSIQTFVDQRADA